VYFALLKLQEVARNPSRPEHKNRSILLHRIGINAMTTKVFTPRFLFYNLHSLEKNEFSRIVYGNDNAQNQGEPPSDLRRRNAANVTVSG